MKIHAKIQVCTDCIMLVAHGDLPGDGRDLAKLHIERWGENASHMCVGDTEKDDEFSWAPCEGCSSKLGGSRHEVVILCNHEGCKP